MTSLALADSLVIPFSCWPKEVQAAFKETGRKVDLIGELRTSDSWGYIMNEGSSYKIHTYNPVTPKDFEVIQQIVFEIELKKRD